MIRRSSSSRVTGWWPGLVELAADVDDRRPLGGHGFSARDGEGGVEILPAVGKQVRRHVENAHQHGRLPKRGQKLIALVRAAIDGHDQG